MQEYTAKYEIKHGVSHGFGLLYDSETKEEKTFKAETVLEALSHADEYSASVADNWLCGNDGKVVVKMTGLVDKNGSCIDVLAILKMAVPAGRALDDFVRDRFPDGQTLTTVRSVADHILDEILKQ
ncbi:hypothetical protein HY485_05045 [Candidatus Woesearchaeota archaeon]|nr:hypothetical protein [Candidatus Woesearchaeota archaeon]